MSEFIDEFIGTWKKVITTPSDFFKEMPTSGGYGEPLKFAVVNYIIAGIGLTLISLGGAFFMIVAMPIIGIIGLFISGAILYICFKIVGGSGSYEGTVRMLSYISAVNAVAWIPILGWIVALYAIYLKIVGGTFVHDITTLRSVIAVFIPLIVVAIILALLIATVGVALLNALGTGGYGGYCGY
ncbi:MAG: hypothetical protein C5S52_03250 [ANME-2 cluster archaeon]|nr:hypothetical protein [ANME-2 cluster archaeon]